MLDDDFPIILNLNSVFLYIGAGVIVQPQLSEEWQISQILYLPDVVNIVLSKEELPQFGAVAEILERGYLINTQREDLQAWHFSDELEILIVVRST